MSAKARVEEAVHCSMSSPMPHPGQVPCYRDKKRHRKWRWGVKKGAVRARRRLDRIVIRDGESD